MISISQTANEHIKKMIAAESAKGFRLSLKKTGCSGLTYQPAIVKEISDKDILMNINDINLYIDAAFESILKDIHIDYIADESTGIKQKKLVFINPNEKARCGCGESFTT